MNTREIDLSLSLSRARARARVLILTARGINDHVTTENLPDSSNIHLRPYGMMFSCGHGSRVCEKELCESCVAVELGEIFRNYY